MKNVCIAGSGSIGTAIANSINENIERIFLYSIEQDVIADINKNRKNSKYFPAKRINDNIHATSDAEVLLNADIVFLAIPSHGILDFIQKNKINADAIIVNMAKGFSKDGLLINQSLMRIRQNHICSLKGPSFANELMAQLPTSFTFGSKFESDFIFIKAILNRDIIVLDYTSDINGIEILSILKNVYSIVMGIVDAYYNSANVRFLVFTKAFNEIRNILAFYNGNEKTINSYCGIGDFGLTSLNDLSRNRTFGLLIGKGFLTSDNHNDVLLEGVRGIKQIIKDITSKNALKDQSNIIMELNRILNREITVQQFINNIIYS